MAKILDRMTRVKNRLNSTLQYRFSIVSLNFANIHLWSPVPFGSCFISYEWNLKYLHSMKKKPTGLVIAWNLPLHYTYDQKLHSKIYDALWTLIGWFKSHIRSVLKNDTFLFSLIFPMLEDSWLRFIDKE